MTRQEAIMILRNTAWLGTNEDREKTEQAIEVVAEELEQKPICCKDCKNWHSTGGTDKEKKGWCSVWKSWNYSKPDDYCSFAEQKESDEE